MAGSSTSDDSDDVVHGDTIGAEIKQRDMELKQQQAGVLAEMKARRRKRTIDDSDDGAAQSSTVRTVHARLAADFATLHATGLVICNWKENTPEFYPTPCVTIEEGEYKLIGPILMIQLDRDGYEECGIEQYIITGMSLQCNATCTLRGSHE